MARFEAWLAIAILTLYVVFIGGAWYGIYAPILRVTSLVLAAGALATWAVVAWRRPAWRPRSALLPAILVCLASLTISTALSKHPRFGIEYVGYAIVLGGLYLLLVTILRQPFFRPRVASLAVGMFAAISGAFLVLVAAHWIEFWGLVGGFAIPPFRPKSESLTYGNPSAVMTISFLLACSSAAVIGASNRVRQVLLTGVVLVVAAVTLVSGSRSGWFATAIAVVATGAVALASGSNRERIVEWARSLRRSNVRLAGALAVAAAGLVIVVAIAPSVFRRLTEGGESLRIGYAVAAMRMFAESPIVGLGPGMWVSNRIRETIAPEADYYIPHAHDIYVQTLAELGLIGAVAGVILGIALFMLIRAGINDPDATRRRWAWAAGLAIVYFGLHQVLDFYANFPSVLFAAALPIAWLDATGEPATGRVRRPGPLALAAGAIVVAVTLVGLLLVEGPAMGHGGAVADANAGRWAEALQPAREAVEADPEWPPYQVTYGLAASRAGDHATAAAAFRRAAETDDQPESWLNLAAEQAELGDQAGALASIDRAMRLGYQRPAVSGAAGDLALRLGATDVAIEGFAWAVAVIPSWAGDPWWTADPGRSAIYDAVVDRAIERAPLANQWEIALMSGDVARATGLSSALDLEGRALAGDAISAWSGDDVAFARLVETCHDSPLASAPLIWCGRIASLRGDDATANRYREWGFVAGTGYQGLSELRVADHDLVGRSAEGELALFYGLYTYRRPTPWNLLGPSLLHFTVE